MRICLLGPTEHPVAEPFAGGLEAMTHALAAGLGARGHDVTLFAHRDSDPRLPVRLWAPADFAPSPAAARDGRAPSLRTVVEHHQYLDLMTRLAGDLAGDFDVVHHNGLHELPLLLAATLRAPMITTLHTPPLPLWESTLAVTGPRSSFVAVSEHVRRSWSHCLSSVVVRNGLDLTRWRSGDGGGPAVWSGRLVPEKAPHEAIDACRAAGVPLVLAGPVHDREYVEREVTPRLGAGATYLGHLRHEELGDWLRRASVAVVTPAWDEPYGLVVSEALASGTPVAGYDRGALSEIVAPGSGVLVPSGDVSALAGAVRAARSLDRQHVRRRAEAVCSASWMIEQYEHCYAGLVDPLVAA
ncbi:glycosyltransferase [Nocardioides sp.]|uniref:glycosyltransferase n=1 Tax=Nocardioides sp. TaxID=35761 RepID=UPI002630DC0B|nr:glycosyltransferase [Nocardioides sp.]